ADTQDLRRQTLGIVGKILNQIHAGIETDDHHPVVSAVKGRADEPGRKFLFDCEPVAGAVTSVDEQGNAQWNVQFSAEAGDSLLDVVFEDKKISLLQVRDDLAIL